MHLTLGYANEIHTHYKKIMSTDIEKYRGTKITYLYIVQVNILLRGYVHK